MKPKGVVASMVALLSSASWVQAAVVHRDIDDFFITTQGGQIDIDGDGAFDFFLFNGAVLDGLGLVISGVEEGSGVLHDAGSVFAAPLTLDTIVGIEEQPFERTAAMHVEFCSGIGACIFSSPLINASASEVFVGIQFLLDGQLHNGMIGLTIFINSGTISVQEYYYESEPGELFMIPSPGVLSMLPMSLLAMRRKRRD